MPPPPGGRPGMPPPPGQRPPQPMQGMPPPPGQMQGLQQGMGGMNLGPKPGLYVFYYGSFFEFCRMPFLTIHFHLLLS
jgi:hypothetical protein